MPFSSTLFLRVEPLMTPAIADAARAQNIGASEFIRRALIQALGGGSFRTENRKPRRASCQKGRLRRPEMRRADLDPPPPSAPAGAMQAAA